MSLPKVIGSETEYGLFLPDTLSSSHWAAQRMVDIIIGNPIVGFYRDLEDDKFLENHLKTIPREMLRRITEHFDGDKKAEKIKDVLRSLGMSGNILGNGARFYTDCGHPEFSTPECLFAKELVAHEKAGERIVAMSREKVQEELGVEIKVHKDNSDRRGNSFAAHENYLLDPETFSAVTTEDDPRQLQLETFFIVRQLLTGSGKIGQEEERLGLGSRRVIRESAPFQISQRADFVHTRIASQTTSFRPIINTRDTPYADRSRFRRLHVIVGDANLCETALFLKYVLTGIVLKMLEDNFISQSSSFLAGNHILNPVRAIKTVSSDPDLVKSISLAGGKKIKALDILREYLKLAKEYFSRVRQPSVEEKEGLELAEFCCDSLEEIRQAPFKLSGYLDWVTKRQLIARAKESYHLSWDSPELLENFDYAYHDLDTEIGLYYQLLARGAIKRMISDADIERAIISPPENTRAFLRGECVKKFGPQIINAAWDFVKLRVGNSYRSIFLPNPLSANKDECRKIIEESSSVEELVANLDLIPDIEINSNSRHYDDTYFEGD